MWTQVIDPFNNLALSALVALVPIACIFWALVLRKMKGYQASLIATGVAILIAILVYGMPVKLALMATAHGAMYGLFPICWIVITAVFLFNLTVKSGQFEVIKHFMASITSDRRLQALLIAFSFGAFLEGTAGFGAPVAITAAMLVGLGFNPLYAAGICLIANTAPVAFGAIGIPVTVAAQVSGLPDMAISQMVGRTLPILSVMLPFYLVVLMSGFKKTREVLPAILVAGLSFGILQWFTSNFLGPALPDVIAGIGSIVCLITLLKLWKPKSIWRFKDEVPPTMETDYHYSFGEILRAWSPFILLTVLVIAWGVQPIKDALNAFGQVQFQIPVIHNGIEDKNGNLLPHIFKLNYLSAAGTAILISSLLSIPLLGLTFREGLKVFAQTLRQLAYPIVTISAVLAFAYILNASGITITLAEALANTGFLFPFFAPVLGWLGVFITGSDTSANALFARLQYETAHSIGVDPVVTVAANASGGVVGKMISPQSIAVAAAAGQLVGKESDLFRFTLKHSFYMLIFICVIVFAQAYWLKWVIPIYQRVDVRKVVATPDVSVGLTYLVLFAIVLAVFSAAVMYLAKRKRLQGVADKV
jgi:lactate permease